MKATSCANVLGAKALRTCRGRAGTWAGACSAKRRAAKRSRPRSTRCSVIPPSRKRCTQSMNRPYTIATLGSHSALQILKGAHDEGFKTLAISNRDTERLYRSFGFVDEVIALEAYSEFTTCVDELANRKVIHRAARIVRRLPLARRTEEDVDSVFRQQGGARLGGQPRAAAAVALAGRPHPAAPVSSSGAEIDRPVIVKLYGAAGGKGLHVHPDTNDFEARAAHLKEEYIIQEYVIGVPLYIHYFYSPLGEQARDHVDGSSLRDQRGFARADPGRRPRRHGRQPVVRGGRQPAGLACANRCWPKRCGWATTS